MDNFEVKATEDNLIKTVEENIIDRNKDIVYFYNILQAQKTSSAIAIDGKWGSGKTFFVKQTKLLISALNPLSDIDSSLKERIIKALQISNNANITAENSIVAIYYDAWRNDNTTDPILSIIYEITKQLSVEFSENNTNYVKLAGEILKLITGKDIKGIIDALSLKNPIKNFKAQKDSEDKIRKFFSEILQERGNRLIVFIDELDRCRPNFAIQLLEQVKHYIQDERITFVFSANLEQLQHTVKHYYGNDFDSSRYLDRFFDLRIALPPARMDKFYEKMGLNSSYWVDSFSRQTIKICNLGLREISRFYSQVKAAIYDPTHNRRNYNFTFSDGEGIEIILICLVPLLIGLKISNISLYDDFVNGRNAKPLKQLFEIDYHNSILQKFLNESESLDSKEGKRIVTQDEIIERFYNAIFVEDYSDGKYNERIGSFEFSRESKDIALRASSMLSGYADLN